jgi:drug/metabolite transporter (DMT)-like permease
MPKSFGLVALLALLWGASFPLLKVAVETLPPITAVALRTLIGGLLLLAILGRDARSLWTSGIPLRSYVAQSTFNCILPFTLVAWASTSIDAALTTILNSLSPIFIFILTWAITRHEPATLKKFIGVMLGIAGVLTIVGPDALSGVGKNTLAELACVAGSFSYAIAAIVGRRFDRVSPLLPAIGATLIAAAVLVPIALVVERPWEIRPSTASLVAIMGSAVLSTAAAFILYFHLIATIGSIATASQAYLRILVGVGIGVTFLGERLTGWHFAGLALVFAGVVAMTMRQSAAPPTPG